jgi:hypothetical protein
MRVAADGLRAESEDLQRGNHHEHCIDQAFIITAKFLSQSRPDGLQRPSTAHYRFARGICVDGARRNQMYKQLSNETKRPGSHCVAVVIQKVPVKLSGAVRWSQVTALPFRPI